MRDKDYWLKRAKQSFGSSEREHAKVQWLDLATYVLNNQSTEFYDDINPGTKHNTYLTSTAAVRANKELASIIHSTVTSPSIKWSKFVFTNKNDSNDPQKVKALENLVRRWYDALNESNFALEVSRAYPQFCCMGNSALFIKDMAGDSIGFNGFKFNALHIGQLAWQEGSEGNVDILFRRLEMTAYQLVTEYGDLVPEEIQEKADVSPDCKYKIYDVIAPRDPKEIELNDAGLAAPEKRPFMYQRYLEKDSTLLEEDGYYEFPIAVFRWETSPGEVYGRSRAHEGLAQIKILNKLEENMARASDLGLSPTFIAERGNIVGNFQIKPGHVNYVRDINGLQPLVSGVDVRIKEYDIPVLKEEIKQLFFLDKLLLPPRTETGEQTAFEIAERIEQAQRVLGPVIGRIDEELLKPVATRTFNIMVRRMLEEEGPNEAKELVSLFPNGQADIKVEFVNPLARSQRISEVSNTRAWVQDAMVMAQADPAIVDNINFDEVIRQIAEVLGISSDMLKSPEEIQQIRQQRAEVQAQQQQAQMENLNADTQSKSGG